MAIDGLIILDPFGQVFYTTHHQILPIELTAPFRKAIIQSGFRSSAPAFPLLHIEAVNAALEKCSRDGDIDPVLFVHSLEHEGTSVCCHVKHGELRFLCPVTGDRASYTISCILSPLISTEISVDPLYVFAFMKTFIDILTEYLGTISAETLKENFDVVYQVCDPMHALMSPFTFPS